MPALIEREAPPAAPRRKVVIEGVANEPQRPYKAPLATFLALLASARATAAAEESLESDELE
jgi:hypothetical protein